MQPVHHRLYQRPSGRGGRHSKICAPPSSALSHLYAPQRGTIMALPPLRHCGWASATPQLQNLPCRRRPCAEASALGVPLVALGGTSSSSGREGRRVRGVAYADLAVMAATSAARSLTFFSMPSPSWKRTKRRIEIFSPIAAIASFTACSTVLELSMR